MTKPEPNLSNLDRRRVLQSIGAAALVGAAPTAALAVQPLVKVQNFRLNDHRGAVHELYRAANVKAVVLITQGNGCPIVRNNAIGYKAFASQFTPKGVTFLMLNSNSHDTPATVAAEAKEWGYDMPILLDQAQVVGKQIVAERTAEVFVIDPKSWKVIYRGPMDDRVVFERQKAKPDKIWATDALNAHLAGRRPPLAYQQTMGCLINFETRKA